MRKTISTNTATTIKIPTPIPALKIPSIAAHDVNKTENVISINAERFFELIIKNDFKINYDPSHF